ncbi:uncharacterized protein [Nicotiana tomentosiformis]|uniref:uncharacterized protein n=1 Tax=Nicotiana tomentosiformis TaxID=4098 RepID=UPI00051B3FE0|nr:uncharacterized protein LOC104091176 isoform X1 [Nicotiana tomentosiformis]XP_033510666.1 uncharacterized protein LOC104091176 isoform X1 [Nicotiana tomentosiformis]XP_033510667.1 uncharacterized protein LOC104091176 isoform X1 [Nicotiana tomentosiformis]XP_033510672.1 uncharacterized protein LOC104091176 isoform X1 [Nicotiana tomentosiformis]XP_033510673.1 uncharacterized protein LOC104091176 isoform X1 [Nicotiana tomentosiformis]
MSFHDKDFWIPKGGGHLSDGETVFDSSSRIEAKRTHRLFSGAAEPELFPNKKQAVHTSLSKSTSGLAMTNSTCWETTSGLQSGACQFIDRLFGVDTTRPIDLTERSTSPGNPGNSITRKKVIDDQIGDDTLVGLSMSYTTEEPQICISDSGTRKVKVNQVEDSANDFRLPSENNIDMSIGQVNNRVSETSFLPMGPAYGKNGESQPYNPGAISIGTIGSNVEKGHSTMSIADSYTGGDSDTSFGYELVSDIDVLARPVGSYDYLHYQSSVQTSETHGDKQLHGSNANAVDISYQTSNSPHDSMPKNKIESKPARKVAPNSFPSNVRSLVSTGMLDGVPVKYVLSRQELRGIIKGSGYLCGCQPCNYSKVLNAYEFERHAGCKTKHPNNHIYFENGKTIYQITQELRSTPQSLLFDAIQTVTGSPINQKAFRIWKESFQAATRELQRIYGKEELNL